MTLAAFACGVLGSLAVLEVAGAALGGLVNRAPRAARGVAMLADALVRLGLEGRDPATAERRQLLAAGAGAVGVLGFFFAGPAVGAVLAAGGPALVARALRARREAFRRAVERDSAALALALADALGAGHSLRAAVGEAARGLSGPAGHEIARVAAELEAGATTEDALERMRARVRCAQVDALVAGCLVQRRAGGDLAALLRDCAEAFGDHARLEDEVRSATAQARFTGLVVVLLPVGGALLAEMASPGFLVGLWGSFLTAWLVGIAIILQLGAALAIRRLGRVRW